ncbi:MAG: hypothetical protein RIQ38_2664, partial [Pseudomonadota bacterium]
MQRRDFFRQAAGAAAAGVAVASVARPAMAALPEPVLRTSADTA